MPWAQTFATNAATVQRPALSWSVFLQSQRHLTPQAEVQSVEARHRPSGQKALECAAHSVSRTNGFVSVRVGFRFACARLHSVPREETMSTTTSLMEETSGTGQNRAPEDNQHSPAGFSVCWIEPVPLAFTRTPYFLGFGSWGRVLCVRTLLAATGRVRQSHRGTFHHVVSFHVL